MEELYRLTFNHRRHTYTHADRQGGIEPHINQEEQIRHVCFLWRLAQDWTEYHENGPIRQRLRQRTSFLFGVLDTPNSSPTGKFGKFKDKRVLSY